MIVRARNQPGRPAAFVRRLAISLLAVAFVTSACAGREIAPSAQSVATSEPSSSPPTAVHPSPTMVPVLPGGRLVYLGYDQEGVGSLFTTNPDGTDTLPLLPIGDPPRWSPGGKQISVVADNRDGLVFVGLVKPDGSDYVQFESPDATLNLGCFAWSPDGKRLACEGWDEADPARNGIYTVRASDGGDLTRVTTSPEGSHDMPSDYSPGGEQIVFTRQRHPDEANTTLMVVNVDGSGARALSDERLNGGRWSRDGKSILTDRGGEAEELLLVAVDSGEITAIEIISDSLRSAFLGAWSPDGEWIVFSGRASKSVDLYIVRVDGSNLHRLTDTPMGQWEEAADWTAGAP